MNVDAHTLEQQAADLYAQATRADRGGGTPTAQGTQLRQKAQALEKQAAELRRRRTDGVRFG